MTEPYQPFTLSVGDRQSPVWRRLKAHYIDKLQELRIKNEGDMTEAERHKLLGRIVEVKLFLALEQDPPDIP